MAPELKVSKKQLGAILQIPVISVVTTIKRQTIKALVEINEKNVRNFKLKIIDIDIQAHNFSIKSSNKNLNRSCTNRNTTSAYTHSEIVSKIDKPYCKFIEKYPNTSRQGEKMKELK